MRFMLLMIPKGYESAPPGIDLDPALVENMMKYNDDLQKAGILLALDGLHPPSTGARVSFKGGKPTVENGPFAGVNEVLGGYWIINVKSRDEAIEWAKRCPGGDNEIVEVRQIQEFDDFSESVQDIVQQYPDMPMTSVKP
ncbi:YciI family protein [Corticibacterium sp. UT-5YL-CI-8]|nr:YciI family protein [Tianweitania sp. UT-5YL-CI-8]